MDLRFEDVDRTPASEQEHLFSRSLLMNGVLPTRTLFPCSTMTADDLGQAEHAFEAGMMAIADVIG